MLICETGDAFKVCFEQSKPVKVLVCNNVLAKRKEGWPTRKELSEEINNFLRLGGFSQRVNSFKLLIIEGTSQFEIEVK